MSSPLPPVHPKPPKLSSPIDPYKGGLKGVFINVIKCHIFLENLVLPFEVPWPPDPPYSGTYEISGIIETFKILEWSRM